MDNKVTYLGETQVDVKTHAEYKSYSPSDWAMHFIANYGQIQGEHHKAWVLDQVARVLHGTPVIVKMAKWSNGLEEDRTMLGEPSERYNKWREEMTGGKDDDGHDVYDYDEGIAP